MKEHVHYLVYVYAQPLSHVRLLAIPLVAHQAPLFMGFPR